MAISVRCGECGKEYRLKDDAAGKTLMCKTCRTPIRVPARKAETVEDDFLAVLKAGNNARALEAAKKAEAAGPENRSDLLAHFWHRAMGDEYSKTGEPKLAVPHYEQAIKKTDIDGYIKDTQKSLDEAKSKAGS